MGDRIRYVGTAAFRYDDNPMVEPGDEGRVIRNTVGQWGRPDLGREFAAALDGWSTVEIKGNRMSIKADSTDRYVRTG